MKNPRLPAVGPDRLLRYRDSIYASDLLICAVAHYDFFSFLQDRPRSFAEIQGHFRFARRSIDVMLSLFLARELLEKSGQLYRLTDLSRDYLIRDSPFSLAPYYASLKTRPQCLEFQKIMQTGRPASWAGQQDGSAWQEAMREADFAAQFTAAMDSRGAYLARALADRLEVSAGTSLLDVAGGSGVYAAALAAKNPGMAATVLEIPPVDGVARQALAARGSDQRVKVLAGDMFAAIPGGYDLHLFANVFHDWDLEAVRKLAANSFAGLRPGGTILVFDAHLNEDKSGPLVVAEYACLLLHATEGRCYSTAEIGEVLQGAGFSGITGREVAAGRTLIAASKR